MKKLFAVAVLVLPLLATPAWAGGWPPYKVEVSGHINLRIVNAKALSAKLGPWYQYWPLEAHFQTPALPHYPSWPSRQSLPGGAAAFFGTQQHPHGGPAHFHASGVQQTSYQRAPGYWHGR